MYHSHIIRESNINTPKLYEGIPSLSFKEGRIASFEVNSYKHDYTPVKDGQNIFNHVLDKRTERDNVRKHRA